MPVELGLGPVPRFWAVWAAAALLLSTGLPVAERVAAAAFALRVLPAWGRRGGPPRRAARLLLPAGRETQWRCSRGDGWHSLQLVAAGSLPGCGWLLRFRAAAGPTWIWIATRRLDRGSSRRLRAAITAGRT